MVKVKKNYNKNIYTFTWNKLILINSDIKLLFVFGIPKSAKFMDVEKIIQENLQFQDMIIPGKSDLRLNCLSKCKYVDT